ncbi:MAG: DUF5666 domain-containing protein [Cellvibrio sp.]|uniref:DUF5666 domain-containing protein n=1 Tax=Cellvibrio sp. TaxID=1965322 RepID=UPI0031A9CDAB
MMRTTMIQTTLSRLFAPLFALITAAILIGCGGTGGSQTAGIDGSGAPVAGNNSNGTISGFGSVIVNGVKYESDKAQILINGQTATEDDLRVGYQVSITGSIANDGKTTAEKIEFVPTLIGEITAIDVDNKRVTVLGQTVLITNNTIFDSAIKPSNINGLAVGQRILVSGAVASDGTISATRIELATDKAQQIMGQVAHLTSNSFTLNGTTVVYSGAQLINLDNNRLINGATVTAIGALTDNQLQATQVIGVNKTLRNRDKVDIEGFVTRFVSATDFDVAGISATTTNQTKFEDGTIADLRLGAQIEIEGSVNASGILVANAIEFEQDVNNKISGLVSSINLTNTTGIISGVITIDGIAITTNHQTRYEDKKLDLKRFNLSSLVQGDLVEVTGYSTAAGFIATKIEREGEDDDDESDEREFEGVISAIGVDHFILFGRKIYVTESTEIKNEDDESISLAAFYLLAANRQIEVEALEINGELYATKIELEDEDD